jgi:hypothetical protein
MRKRMRRRLLSMLTALCMVLSLLPGSAITAFAAAADFAGGDGTLENPYQIKTVEQLKKWRTAGQRKPPGIPVIIF